MLKLLCPGGGAGDKGETIMAMMTGAQYIESLRKLNTRVYMFGEKIENWVRDKQKTTYIHINEEWKNCEFQYPGWIK